MERLRESCPGDRCWKRLDVKHCEDHLGVALTEPGATVIGKLRRQVLCILYKCGKTATRVEPRSQEMIRPLQ